MLVSEAGYEAGGHQAKILDKALELFAAKGYDSVSVGDIAKAVGIKSAVAV